MASLGPELGREAHSGSLHTYLVSFRYDGGHQSPKNCHGFSPESPVAQESPRSRQTS